MLAILKLPIRMFTENKTTLKKVFKGLIYIYIRDLIDIHTHMHVYIVLSYGVDPWTTQEFRDTHPPHHAVENPPMIFVSPILNF